MYSALGKCVISRSENCEPGWKGTKLGWRVRGQRNSKARRKKVKGGRCKVESETRGVTTPNTRRIICCRRSAAIDRHLALLEEDAPVIPQWRQRPEGHLARAVEKVVHRIFGKEAARGGSSSEEVLDSLFARARRHRLGGM